MITRIGEGRGKGGVGWCKCVNWDGIKTLLYTTCELLYAHLMNAIAGHHISVGYLYERFVFVWEGMG